MMPDVAATAAELLAELERLRAENLKLKAETRELAADLAKTKGDLKRAKDPSPVERPSLKRVLELAQNACMRIMRIKNGWELRMGDRCRKFRFLRQIWEILIQEDWILSEIFPPNLPNKVPRLPRRWPSIAPAFYPDKPTPQYSQ